MFVKEVFDEIETPRGVSHTFSPLKSEFAFGKLVLTICLHHQNVRVCGKIAASVPEGGLEYPSTGRTAR